MSDLLLFGDATTFSLAIERTIVYAVWYSALFWLPVRGIAAMIDYRRALGVCEQVTVDPAYRIGMDVVPPM